MSPSSHSLRMFLGFVNYLYCNSMTLSLLAFSLSLFSLCLRSRDTENKKASITSSIPNAHHIQGWAGAAAKSRVPRAPCRSCLEVAGSLGSYLSHPHTSSICLSRVLESSTRDGYWTQHSRGERWRLTSIVTSGQTSIPPFIFRLKTAFFFFLIFILLLQFLRLRNFVFHPCHSSPHPLCSPIF